MVDGASKMLNHVALQILRAGLKKALGEELLKAMPARSMKPCRQALTLERITAAYASMEIATK
jgi:hypothetical protein